jgi:hypothetical protein
VRAADLEPTPCHMLAAVGFGAFDMLIAIFAPLIAGFLAGRLCHRRPQATTQDGGNYADLTAEKAACTSTPVYHLMDQSRVAHVDLDCVALRKATAEVVMRRVCKICGLQR